MNKSFLPYINTVANILIAFIFLAFPLFFLTITTDFYTLPKQALIVFASLALFILWAVKSIAERKVTLVNSPLSLPVVIFTLVVIASTIFSVSTQSSIIQMLPVALLGLFFFAVTNFIQDKSSFTVAIISLIAGTSIAALLSIFARFGINVLPFEATQNPTFNTFGAPVQYLAFITPILVLSVASLTNIIRGRRISNLTKDASSFLHIGASIVIIVAILATLSQVLTADQKPILLPFNDGFQIAFASISQDANRLAQSLLLGSGYGTFAVDFTRFISESFNTNNNYWNLTFSFSSSYVLELLATTGVLGLFSYAFIFANFIRSKKATTHPLFLAVLTVFVLSLIVPFSYSLVFLLFGLLALYVSHRAIEKAKGFDSVEINFVTFNKGFLSITEEKPRSRNEGLILPFIVLVLSIGLALYVGLYLSGTGGTERKGYVHLINSDIAFAKSLTAESLQNGISTYTLQTEAINEYPFRGDYYRLFSQINLALAANLVSSQQGQTPSQEVQQNIIGLLQQSINAGRQAVTIAPYTASNWQNLGQIYRNLIGVGQNAEQFAVASYNQAIALSPNNPAYRVEVGGIYYQLQSWDLAIQQFNIAAQKKPDYANAYYNLGKAYEQRGDLQIALNQYQIVRQLVANDEANTNVINQEISAIEAKIGQQAQQSNADVTPTDDTTPLGVDQPEAEFPESDPRVSISPPPPTPAVAAPSPAAETPTE